MTIIESMTASRQRHMAAVLSLLFDTAMRWGFADANLAKDPGIQHQSRRDQVWSASDIAAFMTHARNHFAADALVTAFTLLLFTAQRPSDVLSMRRDQYKDGWFRIRQQKTKALVEAPLHKAAVPVIEAALKRPSLFLVSRQDGQPIKQVTMNRWFREVQEKAGIQNLQPRDLRRTAIVLMGEAGVSIQMIAAVSGHTKDSVMKIIETYMPSTRAMAESAIRGWEEHQARTDRQGGV
ncbi:tyrosine-type recombinase/integrase [Azospirillum argentinense]